MNLFDKILSDPNVAPAFKRIFQKPAPPGRYLNGAVIRVEVGREGSPVCHVVWDSYAQRECRTYPLPKPAPDGTDWDQLAQDDRDCFDARIDAMPEPLGGDDD